MLSSLWSKKRFGNRSMYSMDWISARFRNAFIPPGYLGQWHLRASMSRCPKTSCTHTNSLIQHCRGISGFRKVRIFLSTRNWKCKVEWSISVPPRVEEKTKRVGCHQQKRRNRNIEMDTKNATISPREPAQRSLKRYLPFHFSIFTFWIHCEKKIMNNKEKLTQLDSLAKWKRIPNHHLHKQYVLNDAVHTEFQ